MRKKCRRRVWKTDIDPIAHAIAGACIVDDVSLNKLRLRELTAIDAMLHGQGSRDDWAQIVDMLNISEMMGKNGIGPEVLPHCEAATEALTDAARRYIKTKKMGLSGPGITAIKEIQEYHDLQRISVSRSTYEAMIEKTRNYIRSKSEHVTFI